MSAGQLLMAILIGSFLVALCLTPVSYRITEAVDAIATKVSARLARDAATFGEPTREQVEADWHTQDANLPRRGTAPQGGESA